MPGFQLIIGGSELGQLIMNWELGVKLKAESCISSSCLLLSFFLKDKASRGRRPLLV